MRFDVTVASLLYEAGFTCDGHPYNAERYEVWVKNRAGRRWAHRVSFPGCAVTQDDEGVSHFADVRPQALTAAEALAENVRQRLADGRRLNASQWDETRPVYGSEAA